MTEQTMHPAPWGLCLAGPTACGKSAVALALAERYPLEIISVDSAQIYRGMDIGTAKPSAAERATVPHHLIDVLDPVQSYSAARFAADATRLAAQIRQRGRMPLLVGGTMLYFKALRDGISAMPAASTELRAQIVAEAAERGWPALHQELAQVDPETAARLAPRDAQRIERALEVWRSSGRSLSAWHRLDSAQHPEHAQARRLRWPLLALEPQSRAWLHQRIEARLQLMQQAGLLEEVRSLRQQGGLHLGLPAMRCVGYRQVWQAMDQLQASGSADGGSPEWFQPALAATRQLAKRQLTWLRSISDRHVVPCDDGDALSAVQDWVGRLEFGQG